MNINEKIHTTLTYKDIAHLTSAVHAYKYSTNNEGVSKELGALINRLGEELYSYPNNNFVK